MHRGCGGAARSCAYRPGNRDDVAWQTAAVSKRLGGIDDLDPMTVPLPPGTEVTTRVDRVVGDRVVTRGAVATRPGDDITDLVGAAVGGFVRSAQAEHPGRFLLLDSDDEEVSWRAIASAVLRDERHTVRVPTNRG